MAFAAVAPYDPTKPIDLSGVDGVTPGSRRLPRTSSPSTSLRLPQWADPAVAEAAGFHSIGDADGGHEHYVQWDWINDDVWLDPTRPRPRLRAAAGRQQQSSCRRCTCCPTTWRWRTSPDYGGALMQWHVHDDLCLTNDPVAPKSASPGPERHVPSAARQAPGMGDDPRLDRPHRAGRSPPSKASVPARSTKAAWCDHAHLVVGAGLRHDRGGHPGPSPSTTWSMLAGRDDLYEHTSPTSSEMALKQLIIPATCHLDREGQAQADQRRSMVPGPPTGTVDAPVPMSHVMDPAWSCGPVRRREGSSVRLGEVEGRLRPIHGQQRFRRVATDPRRRSAFSWSGGPCVAA